MFWRRVQFFFREKCNLLFGKNMSGKNLLLVGKFNKILFDNNLHLYDKKTTYSTKKIMNSKQIICGNQINCDAVSSANASRGSGGTSYQA